MPQWCKTPSLIFWSDSEFLEKENNELMKKILFRAVLHNKNKVDCKESFQHMKHGYDVFHVSQI